MPWAVRTAKTGLSGESRTFVGRHCTVKREIAGNRSAPSNTGGALGIISKDSKPLLWANNSQIPARQRVQSGMSAAWEIGIAHLGFAVSMSSNQSIQFQTLVLGSRIGSCCASTAERPEREGEKARRERSGQADDLWTGQSCLDWTGQDWTGLPRFTRGGLRWSELSIRWSVRQ